MSDTRLPNICIAGPMVGHNPGYPITQGETLANLLHQDGHKVHTVSTNHNRYYRLVDILSTIFRKRNWIDILILHIFGYRSFVVEDLASSLGRRLGLPIVMVLHGGDLPRLARKFPGWVIGVMSRADILVAPSDYLVRELSKLDLENLTVIPNVIEINDYPFSYRTELTPRNLGMRAFYGYYNPNMALRMFKRIRQNYPDAHLTMAGIDKAANTKTKKSSSKMGLSNNVDFPGFLDHNAKIRAGKTHDIFINTNIIENMPVTLLEMAAMGLPIVATNVGGIPDLLKNNESGLLVPDDDDQKMAEAVTKLLRNPDLAGNLSMKGRKLAEMCSWGIVGPQWKALLNELFDKRRLYA